MHTNETRPESVCNDDVLVPATAQDAPERLTGAITTCKRIVPSLSAIAVTFLINYGDIIQYLGGRGGGHGGGGGH